MSEKQLTLVELTVSFEASFEAAAERKETNCQDLVSNPEQNKLVAGYEATGMQLLISSS